MPGPLAVGEVAPDFTLPGVRVTTDGTAERRDFGLARERGRPVALAFYPGDNTSVCTKQLCSYSSGLGRFEALDALVWGISPQDVDSHEEFARARGLRLPLLADSGRTVAEAYGITAPVIGLRRAVFLVGATGVVRWRHVALVGATFQPVDELIRHLADLRTAG